MNINLILEGGGALGVTYIGAYKALMRRGYNIKRCAGTSIGSLMAALITAGYTPEELEEIFFGEEFNQFLKISGLGKKIPPYKALNIFLRKGVYDSRLIEKFVEKLLADRGIVTFSDIMKRGKNKLTIIAADITNRRLVIMPDDLKDYGIDPKNFKIAKAVRMSCAIPILFTPVAIKKEDKLNFIVDGGLLSNFPVWVFDVEGETKNITYGIKIDEKPSNTSEGKTDLFSYIVDVLNTPLDDDRVVYVRDKEKLEVINIKNNYLLKSTDFYKLNKFKEHLYTLGYSSVEKYFDERRSKENFN